MEWLDEDRYNTCSACGQYRPGDVEDRYSFGVPAGRLCSDCCRSYPDHCGLNEFSHGDPSELEEPYWEAI